MPISIENKKISKILREVFGGHPKYTRYADEEEKATIDILSCINSPWEGITSFGTLGLSDYSIRKEVDNVPLGVELVGACDSKYDFFPNILATCAFNIINSSYRCEPGTIYADIIEIYFESPLKHLMFVTPFVWEKKLETLYFQPQKIVAWLLIVPISNEEMEYSKLHGAEALERLFEKRQIDIFNLSRESVC